MIQREKIEELLKLSVDERRRVLRLLQESLPEEEKGEPLPSNGDQTSPAAKWLLSPSQLQDSGEVPGNDGPPAIETV